MKIKVEGRKELKIKRKFLKEREDSIDRIIQINEDGICGGVLCSECFLEKTSDGCGYCLRFAKKAKKILKRKEKNNEN